MELLFCFLVAWLFVKDTAVDGWAMARGQKPPRHLERMARRQQEHERRLAAMKHRSAERVAGVGGPTVQEAFAGRIGKGPKARADMHGFRAWWFDLRADTAERLTRERRAREERTARGEQEWQRFGRTARDWYRRTGDRAGQWWQERNAPRDPHRRWVDSERTDRPSTSQPDPAAPETTADAEVVDDPQPVRPQRPELEPGWPRWGHDPKPNPEPVRATPRASDDTGGAMDEELDDATWLAGQFEYELCHNCGGDSGQHLVSTGPFGDRHIACRSELGASSGADTSSATLPQLPQAPVYVVAERIPELPEATPAGNSTDQSTGGRMEIISPETAVQTANFFDAEFTALIANVDARLGELDAKDVQGREFFAAIRDKLAGITMDINNAAEEFQGHVAKKDALHAGGAPGDGDYMGLDVGTGVYSMHHGIPGGGGS